MDPVSFIISLITELTAGIVGAVVAGITVWLWNTYKNYKIEKQYTIAGDYRAYYYNVENGVTSVEKSDVTIRQKGLHIEADDYDEESGIDWVLNGEIDPVTSRIYGTYKTKTLHDTGLAVCIFKQEKNGVLDGLWAGYDQDINNIEHGRYMLIKRLPITVRPARVDEVVTVLEMIEQQLGDNWLFENDLDKAVQEDMLYVADHDGQVAGFALLRMIKAGEFKKELLEHTYRMPRDLSAADKAGKVGLIEAMATSPDFQKRGIGTELVNKSIEILIHKKAQMVVALGWKTDHVHIGPTLVAAGFKERKEFEKFWYNESKEKDYGCPHCGIPCNCSMVLFTRALTSADKQKKPKTKKRAA